MRYEICGKSPKDLTVFADRIKGTGATLDKAQRNNERNLRELGVEQRQTEHTLKKLKERAKELSPQLGALERAKGQLAGPEIESLLEGEPLALLRELRLEPFKQWLNRLRVGAGGCLAPAGWAAPQRVRIEDRLAELGIGPVERQSLAGGLDPLDGDPQALAQWLDRVAAAIPRRELLRPPPQPHLGALIHGMRA